MDQKNKKRIFTDRESGTYGGLMLSLRKYRDRLVPYPGYQLNKKPRQMDVLLIDRLDDTQITDNDIARLFVKHNIVELKNPGETLDEDTIWKTISYATQYKSQKRDNKRISVKDISITILRSSQPRKAIAELKEDGYTVENKYPGIYYIYGMVDIRLQIVVSSELVGDEYVPLRLQRKHASQDDFRKFAEHLKSTYTKDEDEYVEAVVKFGMYDDVDELVKYAKGDSAMYDKLMELFKDDMDKKFAEGEQKGLEEGLEKGLEKGREEGREERKKLEQRIRYLEDQMKKAGVAML